MAKPKVEIIFDDHTFVAVIGTAGGKKDPMNEKLDEDLFRKMRISADKTITNDFVLNSRGVILVSGGAAWSDHVAVELYKTGRYGGLHIYFPCDWEEGKHKDTGEYDWRTNPGRLANSLHDSFSQKIGRDSQSDFSLLLKDENVQFFFGKGFHTRNSKVANVEYMVAFTFGEIKGGTSDTWGKCKGIRHHTDIESLLKK